ncbi:hypothetical protein HSB1_01170 [Halogranum salarium B-1]|uniref:Uncharacterized protein n=1 Tax=Halogranum salarium B-1 TaxID=1210908 RepID=J3JHL2_9EURY|nr:hypothetical protein HSB1_01170 [Halogranum salarium B-1]
MGPDLNRGRSTRVARVTLWFNPLSRFSRFSRSVDPENAWDRI